jgi:hypothetical protein
MAIDAEEQRRLTDDLAIRNLVARYADAVSHADESAWIGTWALDGRWTIAGTTSEGHDGLVQTWRSLMGLFERVVQLPQSGFVELAGDRASGRWQMVEIGRGRDGSSSVTLGSYRDDYRRVDSGWRFDHRRFDFVYTGPPDLSGQWIS